MLFKCKIFILVLVFSALYSFGMYAQRGECKEIKDPEANRLYQEALGKPPYKIKEALVLLDKAIQLQPEFVDAYYKQGELCYSNANKMFQDTMFILKDDVYFKQAEKSFLKVVNLCPSFNYHMADFYLGQFYFYTRNYINSEKHLSVFVQHNNEKETRYHEAKDMLAKLKQYFLILNNPVPFNPKRLSYVCTSNDEYLPLISPDEEYLFFSRRFKKNPNTSYEEYIEELDISDRIISDSTDMIFTKGNPMPLPFNDGRNQGGASITIDNNHLYITICEYERIDNTSFKNCDIFTSDNIGGKWSPLRRLGKEINNFNTFEGMPSVTSDGKVLFFASSMEGGYGGLDIYKSVKDLKGNWSKAENLGPVINTRGDDKTPFIHSDSQTLYFSSNGRFGMGGFDIYYSKYSGNGQWSEPKNMGYPINTEKDDLGMMVTTNGKQFFFSSRDLNKSGDWDIYSASLYSAARPKKVLFVKGKLTDEKGKDIPNAHVGLTNIESKEYTEGMVDEHSGKYAVAVPIRPDEAFLLTAKKDGYFFNSQLIKPDDEHYEPPTTIDLKIEKMVPEKIVKLQNVNFEINSHKLDEIGKVNINLLVELMKENPTIKVELHGHTDDQGSMAYNDQLSIYRVKAVREYICSQGISSGRITYVGYGKRKPIANNSSWKGKALNRRVEFIVK